MQKQNLLHVIIGLSPGGTEYKLLNLVKDTSENFNHTIIVLTYAEETIKKELELNKIKLIELNLRRIKPLTKSLFSLRKELQFMQFDLIVSWLYHSNLFALFLRTVISSKAKLIWNIRSSMSSFKDAPLHRKIVIYISKFLVHKADGIAYNSRVSMEEHIAYGFKHENEVVINNGVNTNKFKPNKEAKQKLCKELGINSETLLIGMCARYHQVKNHLLLIKATCKLIELGYEVNCLLCGKGMNTKNAKIMGPIERSGKKENFILLDHRNDTPLIYSALDIHILTSFSESSSNSVMESLSCGTKCISTNVGNSSDLLSEKCIVENNNIEDLIESVINLIGNEDESLSSEYLRQNITNNFSIEKMNRESLDFYKGIMRL